MAELMAAALKSMYKEGKAFTFLMPAAEGIYLPHGFRTVYEQERKFRGSREEILKEAGGPCQLNHIGSLGCLFFTEQPVHDYASAKTSDTKAFARYFSHMLKEGIHDF